VFVLTAQARNTDPALYAFDANGCGASTCDPQWVTDHPVVVYQRPVAGPDGTVFVTHDQNDGVDVEAIDAATGDLRWRTQIAYSSTLPGGLAGLAVSDDTLYVTGYVGDQSDSPGTLDAYPAHGCGAPTCPSGWRVPFAPGVRPSMAPTVAGDVVYVGLRSTFSSAPALVAADADGCGQPTCGELVRRPLIDGSGPFPSGLGPGQMSVAEGQVALTWSTNIVSTVVPPTYLMSFAATAPAA
jgi:hypothetical protein